MDLLILLCGVFIALGGMAGSVKQLQMYQQNSYFLKRYLKWLANESNAVFYFKTGFVTVIALLVAFKLQWLALVCAVLFAAVCALKATGQQKKAIKPLVFTKRILRQCLCIVLIFAVILVAFAVFENAVLKIVALTLCVLMGVFSEIVTLLSSVIMKPVEKAITNGFINDAKKILKSHKNLKVIGVTGSYGKTSLKFILSRILSEKFNVLATPQSFNTPMGVVRTVREKLRPQTEIFVCEMGAKNVGDIKEICDIANPTLAVITSVGPQHLETFKTLENVTKTKFELYDAVKKKGGKVFANVNSAPIKERYENGADIVPYGTEGEARATNIVYTDTGTAFDVVTGDKRIHLTTKLLGTHNVINITGAVAVADYLGLSESEIAFAVSRLEQTEHRLQLKPFKNGSVMIDDAYNSNPEGCLEAVNVLSRFEGKFKVIITPGLVELGEKEYECNYNLGAAAAKGADLIIAVGKKRSEPIVKGAYDSGAKAENVFVAESFMDALKIFEPYANKNTVLLVENDLPDNYLK